MTKFRTRLMAALTAAMAVSLVLAAPADARRGGSFGSRGSRTYYAPRPTYTSPGYVPPVQRSMTPGSAAGGGYAPYGAPARPSYMPGQAYGYPAQPQFRRPGFGGGLATGLVTGGLIGMMMGHGFGGGWGGYGGYGAGYGVGGGMGFLAAIIQLAVLGLIIAFVVRLFRRRRGFAGAGYAPAGGPFGASYEPDPQPGYGGQAYGGPWGGGPAPYSPADENPVSAADRATFERLLTEVQSAFGREDYAALRERCTPEVMSYLAEELSDNAVHGRRNEVSNLRLLGSDVSEAWSEGGADYVTMALRYESIDVMRDRTTGAVLQGDPARPTQTTELWTFVRQAGGPWKLSAIQEVN